MLFVVVAAAAATTALAAMNMYIDVFVNHEHGRSSNPLAITNLYSLFCVCIWWHHYQQLTSYDLFTLCEDNSKVCFWWLFWRIVHTLVRVLTFDTPDDVVVHIPCERFNSALRQNAGREPLWLVMGTLECMCKDRQWLNRMEMWKDVERCKERRKERWCVKEEPCLAITLLEQSYFHIIFKVGKREVRQLITTLFSCYE